MRKKLVVGIAGASGSIYAKRLLIKLSDLDNQIERVDVVFSSNAAQIWQEELLQVFDSEKFKCNAYRNDNFMVPFASGSSLYDAMVVIPCSMGVIGRVASGVSNDLISRACDVFLKERRTLLMVPRETPYSLIHLRNMTSVTESGAIILPATPSFYSNPKSIDEVVDTVVDRILDHLGLIHSSYRWGE